MVNSPSTTNGRAARLAVLLMVAMAGLGAIWYGASSEVQQRIWRDILDRPGGPMTFRFLLQPLMATVAAARDGFGDARTGRSPYLWTMLSYPPERGGRLREGIVATGRILLLGLAMDGIYQAIVLETFYPGETVIIAILLAFVPYALLRGPAARFARWWRRDAVTGEDGSRR